MEEQEKRGAGRPPKIERKQRINITLSPSTLTALDEKVPLKQHSAFIEQLIRRELELDRRP